MNIRTFSVLVAGLLLAAGATVTHAQKITIGSGTVQTGPGGAVPITIAFDPEGAGIGSYNTVFTYDKTILTGAPTLTTAPSNPFGTCVIDNSTTPATVSIGDVLPAGLPVYDLCTITFPVAPGTPVAAYPLAHQPAFTAFYSTATGNPAVPGTVTDGAINVIAAPPDVVVTFSPNYGTTINFPGGTVGTNQTANISVSNTGSVGTGTVDNCTFGGANPGAFSVTSGIPATVPPNATIALQATLAATPLAATLTCRVTDTAAGSPNMRTWDLSAPAGTPVPAPGYSSVPAPGSLMSQTGVPGTTLTYTVVITNTGNPGPGSDMSYTCSVAGPDFAITSGAAGGPLAVGSSATVTIEVTAPADGVTVNDVMTCTSSELPNLLAEYDLEAIGLARVAPTFVPASSLWSKLALFGIFAALGMLIIGLRRSH